MERPHQSNSHQCSKHHNDRLSCKTFWHFSTLVHNSCLLVQGNNLSQNCWELQYLPSRMQSQRCQSCRALLIQLLMDSVQWS